MGRLGFDVATKTKSCAMSDDTVLSLSINRVIVTLDCTSHTKAQ